MKKYKELVVGSLLTALIFGTPALSFAESNNQNRNEENKNKIKSELSLDIKSNKDNENKENKQENNKQEASVIVEVQKASGFFSSWFKNNSGKITAIPAISNLVAIPTKPNKATITWDTDNRANSYVWYGTTSPVDTSVKPMVKRSSKTLDHKIKLKKLLPNTTYYVIVGSSNNMGDVKSSEISFTTPLTKIDADKPIKIDTDKPIVAGITGTTTLKIGETASVIITATDPQNKAMIYSANWGDNSALVSATFTSGMTLSHIYTASGTYDAKFTITNVDGKKVTATQKIIVTAI